MRSVSPDPAQRRSCRWLGTSPGTLREGKWTHSGPSFSLKTAVPDIPADHRPWASWGFTRSQGFTPSFTRSLSSPLPRPHRKAYTHGDPDGSLLVWGAELFQERQASPDQGHIRIPDIAHQPWPP